MWSFVVLTFQKEVFVEEPFSRLPNQTQVFKLFMSLKVLRFAKFLLYFAEIKFIEMNQSES